MGFGGKTGGTEDNKVLFGGANVFERTYREGMALVEEAATYLDGPGREDSKDLPRPTALAYATESMRLTTRLMQVAAWLLVRKAVHEGDMSEAEALAEKYKLGGHELASAAPMDGAQGLPAELAGLIERSQQIFDRVDRLDAQLRGEAVVNQPVVSSQQDKVEAFFRETLSKDLSRH